MPAGESWLVGVAGPIVPLQSSCATMPADESWLVGVAGPIVPLQSSCATMPAGESWLVGVAGPIVPLQSSCATMPAGESWLVGVAGPIVPLQSSCATMPADESWLVGVAGPIVPLQSSCATMPVYESWLVGVAGPIVPLQSSCATMPAGESWLVRKNLSEFGWQINAKHCDFLPGQFSLKLVSMSYILDDYTWLLISEWYIWNCIGFSIIRQITDDRWKFFICTAWQIIVKWMYGCLKHSLPNRGMTPPCCYFRKHSPVEE